MAYNNYINGITDRNHYLFYQINLKEFDREIFNFINEVYKAFTNKKSNYLSKTSLLKDIYRYIQVLLKDSRYSYLATKHFLFNNRSNYFETCIMYLINNHIGTEEKLVVESNPKNILLTKLNQSVMKDKEGRFFTKLDKYYIFLDVDKIIDGVTVQSSKVVYYVKDEEFSLEEVRRELLYNKRIIYIPLLINIFKQDFLVTLDVIKKYKSRMSNGQTVAIFNSINNTFIDLLNIFYPNISINNNKGIIDKFQPMFIEILKTILYKYNVDYKVNEKLKITIDNVTVLEMNKGK